VLLSLKSDDFGEGLFHILLVRAVKCTLLGCGFHNVLSGMFLAEGSGSYSVIFECLESGRNASRIDLVHYRTNKITHQDVGLMDMYVRMFDELQKQESDNPTLGIILCTETDEDVARYSILKGNEQLFASKYKLFLPTEQELAAEIEHEKRILKSKLSEH